MNRPLVRLYLINQTQCRHDLLKVYICGLFYWHVRDHIVVAVVFYGQLEGGTFRRLIIAGEGATGSDALKLSGAQITNQVEGFLCKIINLKSYNYIMQLTINIANIIN